MKNFILTGIAFLVLSFHSCIDKNEYITEEVVPFTYTLNIKIDARDWQQSEDMTGIYYYYEVREEKLTQEILNNGIMQAFYCYTLEGSTERYVLLPYEDYWSDFYTEYFTVEFSRGFITFLYKTNSGSKPPERNYDFRVRFLW